MYSHIYVADAELQKMFKPLIDRWQGHLVYTHDDKDYSPVIFDIDTNIGTHIEALMEAINICYLSFDEMIKDYEEHVLVQEHSYYHLWLPGQVNPSKALNGTSLVQ